MRTLILLFAALSMYGQTPASINGQSATIYAGNFSSTNPAKRSCTVGSDVILFYAGIPYTCKGSTGVNAGAYVSAAQSPITISATDYIVAGNDGIINAQKYCALQYPTQCLIVVPSNYPGSDTLSGFQIDFTQTDVSNLVSNTYLEDQRTGNVKYSVNDCHYSFSNQCSGLVEQGVYWATQVPFSNTTQHLRKNTILAGGSFTASSTSNYGVYSDEVFSKTAGQVILYEAADNSFSINDALLHSEAVNCLGGTGYASFAEGCEWADLVIGQLTSNQGAVEFQAPVLSAGTNLNTLTLGPPAYGKGTLGESRWLVNTTHPASLPNTMLSNVCTEFGSNPCLVTLGSTVASSTARGTVTTPITTLGSQLVTPTLTTGTVANFLVGTLACLADPGSEPEMVNITANNTTTGTITIAPKKTHATGYMISTGGLCGYIMEINADRVTNATHPEITQSGAYVQNTLHRSWMVIDTPSPTTAHIAVQGKGAWRAIQYNSSWSATNNVVTFWPAAKVFGVSTPAFALSNPGTGYSVGDTLSITETGGTGAFLTVTTVSSSGAVLTFTTTPGSGYGYGEGLAVTGGTGSGAVAYAYPTGDASNASGGPMQVADNIITWTANDIAEEFLGAAVQMSWGNHNIYNYFGDLTGAGGGLGYSWNGIMNSGDTAFHLGNNTPISYYTINGGTYLPPYLESFTGQYLYNRQDQYAGQYGVWSIGCRSDGCLQNNQQIIAISDGAANVSTTNPVGNTCTAGAPDLYYNSIFYICTGSPLRYTAEGTNPTLSGFQTYDLFGVNMITGEPYITAGNRSVTYAFKKDGLSIPISSAATSVASTGFGDLHISASTGSICYWNSTGAEVCPTTSSSGNPIRGIGAIIDGGGLPLTGGKTVYFTVPFACTISAWNMTVDTGTASLDVWKIGTGTAIPTLANSIVAGNYPAISTGTAIHSTVITGWTTTVNANDMFAVNIQAVNLANTLSLVLQCQ